MIFRVKLNQCLISIHFMLERTVVFLIVQLFPVYLAAVRHQNTPQQRQRASASRQGLKLPDWTLDLTQRAAVRSLMKSTNLTSETGVLRLQQTHLAADWLQVRLSLSYVYTIIRFTTQIQIRSINQLIKAADWTCSDTLLTPTSRELWFPWQRHLEHRWLIS